MLPAWIVTVFFAILSAATTSAEVFRMPIERVDTPAAVIMNNTSLTIPAGQEEQVGLQAKPLTIIKQHQLYVGHVTIGTPRRKLRDKKQTFTVVLDSGSANLWVLDRSVKEAFKSGSSKKANRKYNFYNRDKSSTYETYLDGENSFDIKYGDGRNYVGMLGLETIKIGSSEVKHAAFARVTDVGDAPLPTEFDGILGLGLPEQARGGATPPFIKMVKDGVVDHAVISIFFECESVGEVIFGGVDETRYVHPLAYAEVNAGWKLWATTADISLGSVSMKNINAVFDTGANRFYAPEWAVKEIVALTGSRPTSSSTDPDYVRLCANIDQLPPFRIVVGGTLHSFTPNQYFERIQRNPTFCILLFARQKKMKNMIQIGIYFFRKYYTVFDYANRRLGTGLLKEYGILTSTANSTSSSTDLATTAVLETTRDDDGGKEGGAKKKGCGGRTM